MSRWLWVAYPLGLISVTVVWGGVLQVLLGKQVSAIIGDPTAAAGALGAVISAGAISSVVAQPVMGRISDRTRTRFLGRRNLWVLISAVVSVGALLATAMTTNLVVLAVVWAVAMWPLSGIQAAVSAVLPERVPVSMRGRMSGIAGASGIVGVFIGVAIAGLTSNIVVGYVGIACVVLALGLVFALTTKDVDAPVDLGTATKAERRAAARFPSFRAAPNFWWAFIGRFLITFGYNIVTGLQLYIVADYVGVGSVDAAGAALVGIQGLNTLALLIFSVLGGWLSDKFGRLRVFVALSSVLFAPAALIYLLFPSMAGALVANVVFGIAFGWYLAVDQALITRVLPSNENAARDLGVMNIANAGPQIIAPAAAGALVALTGGYQLIFVVCIVAVLLGALSVRFIKGIR